MHTFVELHVAVGTFVGYLTGFLASLVILNISYTKCHGASIPITSRATFYGFRWALICFSLAQLLDMLSVIIPATTTGQSTFLTILVLAHVFMRTSLAILAISIIKTATTSLAAAGTVRHANKITAILVLPFTLTTIAEVVTRTGDTVAVVSQLVTEAGAGDTHLRIEPTDNIDSASTIYLAYDILFLMTGLVMLGVSITASRRGQRATGLKRDNAQSARLTVAAASLWTALSAATVVFDFAAGLSTVGTFWNISFSSVVTGSEIAAGFVTSALTAAIFSTLVRTYRHDRGEPSCGVQKGSNLE